MMLPTLALVVVGAAPLATPLDAASATSLIESFAGTDARLFPSSLHVVHVEPARIAGPNEVGDEPQFVVVIAGVDDNPVNDELRRETLLGAMSAASVRGGLTFLVMNDAGDVRELGHDAHDDVTLPSAKLDRAQEKPRRAPLQPNERRRSEALPFGAALLGMRIAISPGHGWIDDDGDGTFNTQRSNHKFNGCGDCRGIVEDFFSSETVMNQIVPLLQGMGATVLIVREPDHLAAPLDPVIVDDGDELYSEDDTLGAFTDGATPGVGFADDYRVNADADPGRAVFVVPPLPRTTRVSLRYPEGTNRTAGAVVSIVHEGGVRTLNFDQTKVGRAWIDLGAFSFGSGGAVELAHSGAAAGFLIADAIKIGGGEHPDARKPWWQMGAKFYVPFAGAPDDVLARNDVTIRPAYAEFLGPDVYVAIHANASGVAGGSSAHGTSTYRYSCSTFGDHTSSDGATTCDDPANSQALLDEVHSAILGELRASWDPGWADRGRLVANFGELRELDDTPGILVETGFFDNLATPSGVSMSDNRALHDPRWRESFARGLVRGLASFLAPGSDAPPLRPDGVVAQNESDGTLRISWNAVPGAVGYRVVRANLDTTRGRGFDEGVTTTTNEIVLDAADALVAGDAYAFRISAANDFGEGYFSQAVVARFRGTPVDDGERVPVLVVWGYDRKDAFVQDVDNDDMGAIEHGRALRDVAFFDGALDEAVEDGAVALGEYNLVDIGVGKDSTEHEPLSSTMQDAIAQYLDDTEADASGAVVLSGEEIGYAMIEVAGSGAPFFLERFSAVYVEDDANTFELAGAEIFEDALSGAAGLGLDDGSALYEVVYPDVWSADGSASGAVNVTTPLRYPDGRAAAVVTERTALFGAGLEAVVDDDARAALFEALVTHLIPGHIAEGEGEGEGEPGEGEGEGEGNEGEGEGGDDDDDDDIDITTQTIPPPSVRGCGCGASTSSPSSPALMALGLAVLAVSSRRRSRRRHQQEHDGAND